MKTKCTVKLGMFTRPILIFLLVLPPCTGLAFDTLDGDSTKWPDVPDFSVNWLVPGPGCVRKAPIHDDCGKENNCSVSTSRR